MLGDVALALPIVVHVLLHLVEHVDALFVHDLIVGVIAQVVIVNTVVVVAVGDFGEHILRHDDGIFELLQHERIVAPVDAGLVARLQSLVQLYDGGGRLDELVDDIRAELVGKVCVIQIGVLRWQDATVVVAAAIRIAHGAGVGARSDDDGDRFLGI